MHAIPHVNWILFPIPPDVLLSFNCSSSRNKKFILPNLFRYSPSWIVPKLLYYYITYQVIFGHLSPRYFYNLYDGLYIYYVRVISEYQYIHFIVIVTFRLNPLYQFHLSLNHNQSILIATILKKKTEIRISYFIN